MDGPSSDWDPKYVELQYFDPWLVAGSWWLYQPSIFIISLKFLDCQTVIYGCCCCCKRKVDWWSSCLLVVLASSARCTTAEGALFLLCYNILPWLSSALCGEMHILGDLDIIWNKKLKKKIASFREKLKRLSYRLSLSCLSGQVFLYIVIREQCLWLGRRVYKKEEYNVAESNVLFYVPKEALQSN